MVVVGPLAQRIHGTGQQIPRPVLVAPGDAQDIPPLLQKTILGVRALVAPPIRRGHHGQQAAGVVLEIRPRPERIGEAKPQPSRFVVGAPDIGPVGERRRHEPSGLVVRILHSPQARLVTGPDPTEKVGLELDGSHVVNRHLGLKAQRVALPAVLRTVRQQRSGLAALGVKGQLQCLGAVPGRAGRPPG